MPLYSDAEYQQHLQSDTWTKQETDHLFDLCRRFDLRFYAVHDRWDRSQFTERSIEDVKERYYDICNTLAKVILRLIIQACVFNGEGMQFRILYTQVRAAPGQEVKLRVYDADHERRRKEQLRRLFERTPEQVTVFNLSLNLII